MEKKKETNVKKNDIKTTQTDINIRKKMTVGLAILILFVFVLILRSTFFKNFAEMHLDTNKKEIFSIKDLTVGNLKYGNSEETVKKELGNPKSEKEKIIGQYNYKILEYNGLKVTLKENYDNYILTKVNITSNKYTGPRDLKVGNKITKAFSNFNVENSTGAYLYGNHVKEALKQKEVTENVYFGIRTSENILYVNRDDIVDWIKTNISKLDIKYSGGKINEIIWSYDIE